MDTKQKRMVGSANSAEVEAKKNRFREFLKVAGTGAGTQKEAQSWNDQFTDFMMARPEERKKSNKNKEAEESKGPEEEKKEGEEANDGGEDKADGEEKAKEPPAPQENEYIDEKRLFVMNLSYQVTKEELTELFEKHGEIEDIEIPFRKHGKGVALGIGFVRFATSESAISAFATHDKTYF